jgi:hypothetical protein
MATNLIPNGTFDEDADSWVINDPTITWYSGAGHISGPGCLSMQKLDFGTAQTFTAEATPAGRYKFGLSIRSTVDNLYYFLVTVSGLLLGNNFLQEQIQDRIEQKNHWYRFEWELDVFTATRFTVNLTTAEETGYAYVDDVTLELLDEDLDTDEPLEDWKRLLMSERDDLAATYHTGATYERVIYEAVHLAPRDLWPTKEDTSLETVAGQEGYSLATLTDLQDPGDVLGVYLRPATTGSTAYQDWLPVGYTIYDNAGTLYLRFDRPWASSFQIRVYYRYAPTQPTASVDTELDRRWMVAECMVRLLRRPTPDLQAKDRIELLKYWQAERDRAHRLARVRRPPRRARTPVWRLTL